MKFKLYQIKDVENCKYAFGGYSTAMKNSFSIDDYEVVYEGEVEIKPDVHAMLETVFYIFNCRRPEDFKGRSMSVSDVVELNGKVYYCDSFGFREIK